MSSSTLRVEPGAPITAAVLDGLPAVVRRYADWSGLEGTPVPISVSLAQTGRIRSANDKPWMPFTAVEDFVTAPLGFTWRALVSRAHVPVIRANDTYGDGHGHMQLRLAGLLRVSDLAGPAMDSAALIRLLNEMAWFPGAYLLPCVSWQEIDDTHARVSLTDAGRTVSATMSFAANGRPIEFAALRERHLGHGRFHRDVWVTPYTGYAELNGVCVPVAGWGEYRLPSGPLRYIELQVRPATRRT